MQRLAARAAVALCSSHDEARSLVSSRTDSGVSARRAGSRRSLSDELTRRGPSRLPAPRSPDRAGPGRPRPDHVSDHRGTGRLDGRALAFALAALGGFRAVRVDALAQPRRAVRRGFGPVPALPVAGDRTRPDGHARRPAPGPVAPRWVPRLERRADAADLRARRQLARRRGSGRRGSPDARPVHRPRLAHPSSAAR